MSMPFDHGSPLMDGEGVYQVESDDDEDERRLKILEMGGAGELVIMLGTTKDDRTRKEALKPLSALSASDEAAAALHKAGATSVIRSVPDPA